MKQHQSLMKSNKHFTYETRNKKIDYLDNPKSEKIN